MTGSERTSALHYEAYVPMALSKFEKIGREVMERWQARCAISHRIGHVGVQEASVVIAVSSRIVPPVTRPAAMRSKS